MKNCILTIVLLFFTFLGTTGCETAPPITTETNTGSEAGYPSAAYPAPSESTRLNISSTRTVEVSTPQSDMATLTGVVISQRTQQSIVEVPVQLAGVYYEGDQGAFVLDTANSPIATTDGQGRFVFVDIEPGDYVIVIGNVEVNDYIIIPDESGRAKIWTATNGEVLETGSHTILLENWE